MKKAGEIKFYYNCNLEAAAKYYQKYGSRDDLYNYYQGVVHGYGGALGYEFERIEADIKNAIEQAQAKEETA